MNEIDFVNKWNTEKPLYKAWGDFIVDEVNTTLIGEGVDVDSFLKIPPKPRLKDDKSFVDKAFNRSDKNYTDPYNQIEDKVGVRFVVLLNEDIRKICNLIEKSGSWDFDPCKDFAEDQEKQPLMFTYQSVHYILKSKYDFVFSEAAIPQGTPCEVQIRTILQHAHSELTHDAVYKAKQKVSPKVHRTVAKSMALIETTDQLFTEVTKELNSGPLKDLQVIQHLDEMYKQFTGLPSLPSKSSLVIWDTYESFIDEQLIKNISKAVVLNKDYSSLNDTIKIGAQSNSFYQQSCVLFVYWMLLKRRKALIAEWPLQWKLLERLASDVGVSLD